MTDWSKFSAEMTKLQRSPLFDIAAKAVSDLESFQFVRQAALSAAAVQAAPMAAQMTKLQQIAGSTFSQQAMKLAQEFQSPSWQQFAAQATSMFPSRTLFEVAASVDWSAIQWSDEEGPLADIDVAGSPVPWPFVLLALHLCVAALVIGAVLVGHHTMDSDDPFRADLELATEALLGSLAVHAGWYLGREK